MKRLRQFYEDHETAILGALSVTGIIVLGVAANRARIRRSSDSTRPLAVDLWQLDGGGASMIVVQTKDGAAHPFIREIGDLNHASAV